MLTLVSPKPAGEVRSEIQARSRCPLARKMASLAQPRGDIPLQAGLSPAKTLRSSDDIIASNLRQIKKSFMVKLLTRANYPLFALSARRFCTKTYFNRISLSTLLRMTNFLPKSKD